MPPSRALAWRAQHASCACREPAREEPAAEAAAELEPAVEPEPAAELEPAAEEDETDEEFFDAEEPETDEPDGRTYGPYRSMRRAPFCMVDGCEKLAICDREGRTVYCIAHGGGLRCLAPGCGQSALLYKGLRQYCAYHGPRCEFDGCTAAAMRGGRCRKHR